MVDNTQKAPNETSSHVSYEESLDIEVASELLNSAVEDVMQAIYAEKAKVEPDQARIEQLKTEHWAIEEDRRRMRRGPWAVVKTVIEKYSQAA